ncbi:hypothetical protein CSUI_005094 [Cystoisospora suis]|uniref:Transmembrane protein n=1 Tax=Cystoisospora suis TaxID=483139 RepID=A0A2C6KKP3_9APIC|nr:hypothetical protein CSUI_005094 [Cystoisospora suis]
MWEVSTQLRRLSGLLLHVLCLYLLASPHVSAVSPLPLGQSGEVPGGASANHRPKESRHAFFPLPRPDDAETSSGHQGRLGSTPSGVLSLGDIFSMYKLHRPALFEGSLQTDPSLSDSPSSLRVYVRMDPDEVAEIVTSLGPQSASAEASFPPTSFSVPESRTFSLLSSAIPPLASFSLPDPEPEVYGFDLRIDVIASAPPLVYTKLSPSNPSLRKSGSAPGNEDTAPDEEEELETPDNLLRSDYTAASVCTWLNRRKLCEQPQIFTTTLVLPLSIDQLPPHTQAPGETLKYPHSKRSEGRRKGSDDPSSSQTSGKSHDESLEKNVQENKTATPGSTLLRLLQRDEMRRQTEAEENPTEIPVFLPATQFSLCQGKPTVSVKNRKEGASHETPCEGRFLSIAITLPFLPPVDSQNPAQQADDIQRCVSPSTLGSSLAKQLETEERETEFLSALNETFRSSAIGGVSSPQRVLLLLSLRPKGRKTSGHGASTSRSFSPVHSAKSFFSAWKLLPPNAAESSPDRSTPFGCSSIEKDATLLARLVSEGVEQPHEAQVMMPGGPDDSAHEQRNNTVKVLSGVYVPLAVVQGRTSSADTGVSPGPPGVSLLHVDLKEKKDTRLFLSAEDETVLQEGRKKGASVGERTAAKVTRDRVNAMEGEGGKDSEGLVFLEVEEADAEDLPTVLICPPVKLCTDIAAYRPSTVFLPTPDVLRQSYETSLGEYQRTDERDSTSSNLKKRWILPLFIRRPVSTKKQQERASNAFGGSDFSFSSFFWGEKQRKEKETETKSHGEQLSWFSEGAHVLLIFPQRLSGRREKNTIPMRVVLLPDNLSSPVSPLLPEESRVKERQRDNGPVASDINDRNSVSPVISPLSSLPSSLPPVSSAPFESPEHPFSFPGAFDPASGTLSSSSTLLPASSFSPQVPPQASPLSGPPPPSLASSSPSPLGPLLQPFSSPSPLRPFFIPTSPSLKFSPGTAVPSLPLPTNPSAPPVTPSSDASSSLSSQSRDASSIPASSLTTSPMSSPSSNLQSWASVPLSFLPSAPQSTSASSVCLFLLLLLVISAVAMLTAVKLAMYMDTATRTRPVPEEASPPSSCSPESILENPSASDLESPFFASTFSHPASAAGAQAQSSQGGSARTPPFSPFLSQKTSIPLTDSNGNVVRSLEETPFSFYNLNLRPFSSTEATPSSDFFSMDFSQSLPQNLSQAIFPACLRRGGLGPLSSLALPQEERRRSPSPSVFSSVSQPICDSSSREGVEKAEERVYTRRKQQGFQKDLPHSEDDDDLVRSFSAQTGRRLSSPTGCSMLLELQQHQRTAEQKRLLKANRPEKKTGNLFGDLFSLGGGGRPCVQGRNTKATDEGDGFWNEASSSSMASLVRRGKHGGGVRTPKRESRFSRRDHNTKERKGEEKTGKLPPLFPNDHYESACSTRAESLLPQQTTGAGGGEEENPFWFSSSSGSSRRSTEGSVIPLSNALLGDSKSSSKRRTADEKPIVFSTEESFFPSKKAQDVDQDVFFRGQPSDAGGVQGNSTESFAFFENNSSTFFQSVTRKDANSNVPFMDGDEGTSRDVSATRDIGNRDDQKRNTAALSDRTALPGSSKEAQHDGIKDPFGKDDVFESSSSVTYPERYSSYHRGAVKEDEQQGRMNGGEQEDFGLFGSFRRAGNDEKTEALNAPGENRTPYGGQDEKSVLDRSSSQAGQTGEVGQREEDFHLSLSEKKPLEKMRKTHRNGVLSQDAEGDTDRLLDNTQMGTMDDDRRMLYVCPRSGVVDPLAAASENPYQVSYRVGECLEAVETTEGDAEEDCEPHGDVRKEDSLLACFPEVFPGLE